MARNNPTGTGRGSSGPEYHESTQRGMDYTDMIMSVVSMEPGKYSKNDVVNRVIRRNNLSRSLERDVSLVMGNLLEAGKISQKDTEIGLRVFPS